MKVKLYETANKKNVGCGYTFKITGRGTGRLNVVISNRGDNWLSFRSSRNRVYMGNCTSKKFNTNIQATKKNVFYKNLKEIDFTTFTLK